MTTDALLRHEGPLDILVTVGMSRHPFDRLVSAVGQIAPQHSVFAQIGPSTVVPPCAHRRYVTFEELQRRLQRADIVVTHAGNTVRMVQSMGRVPIAIARRAHLREMSNDHQVTYLAQERVDGRVIALDDVDQLAAAVASHRRDEQLMLATRPASAPVSAAKLIANLDLLFAPLLSTRRHGQDRK